MIDPRFLIDLKGRQYVLYAGLLDLATRSGLKELSVRLLQVPDAANGHLAIAEAIALFEDGRRFTEIGDAGPQNLSPQMISASCRMAATRSKARVLRDALNVWVCSFEELPPEQERFEQQRPAPVNGNGQRTDNDECNGCGAAVRAAQATYTRQRYAKALCLDCQPAASGRG